MAKCIVQLNSAQAIEIKRKLLTSKFAFKLHDYYQGVSNEYPPVSELAEYINDKVIPVFFKGAFKPQDAVDFLDTEYQSGLVNSRALGSGLEEMLGARGAHNPQGLPNPDYVKKPGLVMDLAEQTAKDRLSADVASKQVVINQQQLEDSSAKGIQSEAEYKFQYNKKYNDLRAYRIGRFRGSSAMEAMTVSKFVNDVLIKQALINTDTRTLISGREIPGVFGEKGSQIDFNLKQYRKQLLQDLIQRLGVETSTPDGTKKLEYSEDLLHSDKFEDAIKSIEQKVNRVNYHGESILLTDQGKLVEIGEEFKKTSDPELQQLLSNYADHVILTDFDKLFDYYTNGSIAVSQFNDPFDEYTRKYNVGKKKSAEEANVNWTDQIRDGIELSSDLYRTITENTPMQNFITGLETSEYLYPALIHSALAKYYRMIDPQLGAASVKDALIKGMNSTDNTYIEKNVLYTLYKRFFEEQGDDVKLHPNNINHPLRLKKEGRQKVVSSFLDTIGRTSNQDLLQAIVKPLQEIVQANYVEGSEVGGEAQITRAGTRAFNVTNRNVRNDITRAINTLDSDGINALVDKFGIQFNSASVDFKAPGTDATYKLTPKGATEYSLDAIMRLSNDLLHIDVENNNAHKEFREELKSHATGKQLLPNQYLVFMYDALKVLQAKKMLFDPEVQERIKDPKTGGANTKLGGSIPTVLTEALQSTTFDYTDPASNELAVKGVAAEGVYNMLVDAQNRYAGNRVKGNKITIDGKSVAAFSTHTLGLGLPQTYQRNRNVQNSVIGPDPIRDPLAKNPFIVDGNLLRPLEIKSAVKIGNQIKSSPAMNDTETLQFDMNLGYFDNMRRAVNKGEKVHALFSPVTYSDKSTNYMLPVNNAYLSTNLFVDPSGVAVHEDVTRQLHFDSVGSFYRAHASNIVQDWRKIYGQVSKGAEVLYDQEIANAKTYSAKLEALNDLNQVFWKTNQHQTEGFEHGLTGLHAARFYADKAGVALNNWVHYQNNKKSMNNKEIPLVVKDSLVKYTKLFDNESSRGAYNEYMDKLLVQSVKDLQNIGYKFTGQTHAAIVQLYPELTNSNFANKNTGEVYLTRNNTKKVESVKDVNPAYRKYFNDFNFVAENFVNATVGSQYFHKGSTPYELLIAQTKRNVALTASMRKYTTGLENGVESHTKTAFMDDFTTQLKTIIGEEHQVVDNDGASLETTTQRLKTWNSLNSIYAGDGGPDHKSIFSHYDPNTGQFTLIKHAAFLMDHDMIRRSIGSDVDLMELHKKLYATDISKVNITKSYKDDVNLTHFQDTPIHYWDRTYDYDKGRAGHIYKLESIEFTGKNEKGESTYTIKKRNLSLSPDELLVENNHVIPTMYDLWKLLGHIDSVEPTATKSSLSYKKGNDIIYFKPSIASDRKLLEYECYIGNGNERIKPAEYVVRSSTQDKVAWGEYSKLFDTPGVVDSHIALIRKYTDMDPESFDTHQQLTAELGNHDVKVGTAEFLESINKNKATFKGFFSRITSPTSGRTTFDEDTSQPYQRFKGKNIDRVSFAGAIKVGQFSMNDTSTLSKRKLLQAETENPKLVGQTVPGIHALVTHGVSNLNGGVQLNAWHEAEEATVTAPTQMLNALSFNGKSIEDVTEIYKALSDIVDKELTYSLDDSEIGKRDVNIPQLVRGLSNAEFYQQNKKTLLDVFQSLLKKNMKNDTFTLENLIKDTFTSANLPIDDTHIFNSAVADLANYFTKSGIRINFDGVFSVLAPSSGMLQFHDVRGGYLPVKGENGTLSYRVLDPTKETTLSRHEYDNWKAYNEWVKNHPEAHDHDNAPKVIDEQPRDLKGQQIRLTYADGSTKDLSILRAGEKHLIPEAEALSKVKGLIEEYKAKVTHDKGTDYGKANITDKQDFLDFYTEDFNDRLAKLVADHADVKHAHTSILADMLRFDPTTSGDLVDILYDKFNANKGYRANNGGIDKSLSQEYDYFDKLNLVGKAFTSRLQQFLDVASTGQIPDSLQDAKLFPHQGGIETAKITVSRAECIAPITARASFLLREGDDIGEVDREFFNKRLVEGLDYYATDANAVLISTFGRRYFIHTKGAPRDLVPTTNTREIGERLWYTDINGDPIFQIPDGVVVQDRGGEVHMYIKGSKALPETLRSNLNRAFHNDGDNFELKPLGANAKEKATLKAADIVDAGHKANMMWASWQKYMNVIGTRIPGQHYQSFQGMKIVGFTEGNKIHIPHEVTLLSGSDFDIDKQNVIYHTINKDGTIALWHPASRMDTLENIEKSMKLPLQQARSRNDFATSKDSEGNYIHPVMQGINDEVDMKNLDVLNDIYGKLKNGFRLTEEEHPNVIDALVDYDTFRRGIKDPEDPYKLVLTQANNGVKGVKNFVISRTNSTIENPSNFIYLSKPVSMDIPKQFAENSPKGESAKKADSHLPTSIARGKQDNMVGKKVIGIMATGLKVWSAISLTYNNELRRLNPIVNEMNRLKGVIATMSTDPVSNKLALDTLQAQHDKYEVETRSVINGLRLDRIPLSRQKLVRDGHGMDLPANLNYDKISSETLQHVFGALDLNSPEIQRIMSESPNALHLKDYLQMRGHFEDDAAELLSQLLSAATDNAKELILAKINASPDLAGMYATMIILNVPFEQIVDKMTSPLTEMLIAKGGKNIFDTATEKNSISDILSNAVTAFSDETPGYAAQNLQRKYGLLITKNGLFDSSSSTSHSKEDVIAMKEVSDAAKEVSLLGRMLSINQGVKSNTWDLFRFRTSIEDYVSKLIDKKFDFKDFLDSLSSDKAYSNQMIDELSDKKQTFNILQVLATNPHFSEQLKAYNAANTILELSSYKAATAGRILEKLRSMNYLGKFQNIDENQYRDIERFVENSILENFIADQTTRAKSQRASPIFYNGDNMMALTTPEGQDTFAKWVKDVFLPKIQDMKEYKGNAFIQALTTDEKRDMLLNGKFGFVKLNVDTSGVKSLIQQGKEDSFAYGLKLLYDGESTDAQHESDITKNNNIVNTLFWYNLILNKNNITKNSYAKILGEVMGLSEGEQNPYRKLLELKGNIGKNEAYEPTNEGLGILVSNGVTFDLFDLFKSYDSFTNGDLVYKGRPRTNEEQVDEDIPDDLDSAEDTAAEHEAAGVDDLDADQFDMTDDLDTNYDEESEGADKMPKIKVNKSRTYGELGTHVEIFRGKALIFSQDISVPGSLISHSSENRTKATYHTDYTPLAAERNNITDADVTNLQKMLHMNMHDLLTSLQAKFDIEIEQRTGDEVRRERFDSNKTYDCL